MSNLFDCCRKGSSMRVFIGIKPDKKALLFIQKIMKAVQLQGITGNYTEINNVHLTLLFLGEVADYAPIKSVMDAINHQKFSICVKKVLRFKDMIILEIEQTKELIELQEKLLFALAKQGYKVEKRSFYPHITLIREVKEDIEINTNICSEVKSYELYASQRRSGKINYSVVYKKMLGCEDCG